MKASSNEFKQDRRKLDPTPFFEATSLTFLKLNKLPSSFPKIALFLILSNHYGPFRRRTQTSFTYRIRVQSGSRFLHPEIFCLTGSPLESKTKNQLGAIN